MQSYTNSSFPYSKEVEEIHADIEKIKADPLLIALADTEKLKDLYNSCLQLAYNAETEHMHMSNEIQDQRYEIERLKDVIQEMKFKE